MNDPTQNELLSAYLDGELTADERAEVERLLEADPTARRALDELRSLSAALRALPRAKLDEDLNERVLCMAAQRMLLEGPSTDDRSSDIVPRERSIFGRLLQPRVLAYAGITIAVAVAAMLVERRQNAPRLGRSGGEPVLARRDSDTVPKSKTKPLAERPLAAELSAEAERPPKANRTVAPTPEMYAAEAPQESRSIAAKPARGFAAARRPVADEAIVAEAAMIPATAPPPRPPGDDDLLVVQCDIATPVAVEKFDKLLAASGISQRRQLSLPGAGLSGTSDVPPAKGDAAKADLAQFAANGETAEQDGAMKQIDLQLFYVEASPEQIAAALAAIATRSKEYSNVQQIGPRLAAPLQHLVLPQRPAPSKREAGGRSPGKSSQQPLRKDIATFGAAPAAGEEGVPEKSEEIPKKKADGVDDDETAEAADQRDETKLDAKHEAEQQAAPPFAKRQRVLFVLQIIADDRPQPAEETEEEGE